MAFNIAAQRAGLKARLDTISGLKTYSYVPGDVNTPAAMLVPAENFIDYHLAMGKGLAVANWRVLLATSRTVESAGQALLDEFLSAGTGQTRSVIDALEADVTLGGAVDHVHVSIGRSYGQMQWNETTSYYGAELLVAARVDRQ